MAVKILAVDDEKSILKLIKTALEKDGYLVHAEPDPERAVRENFAEYDLILLDVMMPEMDGFTFCERIREQADCPILFLTAKMAEEDMIRGLGLGGDDYITKPFGIGELRARVQAHLRRERRERKYIASIDGVQFQLQAKKVFYEGEELSFTKGEYAICEYLALHRGQTFSREQIYEQVYGYDKESDSSAITEHIKNIRAKCAKAGFAPIETVWGIGYRWK